MRPFSRYSGLLPVILAASVVLIGCSDSSLRHYNLGVEAADRGDLEVAVDEWTQSVDHRPDDPDTRYNLGMALMELDRDAESLVHLDEAVRLSPDDHEVQYAHGRVLEKLGRYPDSKKAYKLSLALKSNYYPPYIGLASIALKQQQYRSAEKYATQGLSIKARDLEGNLILSEAYFQQGNYQEAYAQLLSIKYLYPRDRDFLLLMGKVMSERNQHVDAITTLTQAKENGASSGTVFYYLGRSSYALDMFTDAEKYFQMAMFKDRDDINSLKGLAETQFMVRNYAKSLENWRKAEKFAQDDPEIQLGIAMVLINTHRPEDAVTVLRKIEGDPGSPPRTLYYLGHALMRSGDKSGARDAFLRFKEDWEGDRSLIAEVNDILVTLED